LRNSDLFRFASSHCELARGVDPLSGVYTHKHQTPKLVLLLIQTSQNYRLPKIKVEPSIKLSCRMSNIDEDKILELEISDDETFGLHGADHLARREGSQKRRFRRLFAWLSNSTVPITLPLTSVPEKLLFAQYIQSSSSSASRVNIYRSRIPLVYPELAASETRFIRFVPRGPTTTPASTAWSKKIPTVVQLSLGLRRAFLDQPQFNCFLTSLGTIVLAESSPKTT